jgi:CheY-like chemotaxis protein
VHSKLSRSRGWPFFRSKAKRFVSLNPGEAADAEINSALPHWSIVVTEVTADLAVSKKLRILVVEDEPLIAMMLEEMLQELGCECIGPIGNRVAGPEFARSGELEGAILSLILGGRKAFDIAEALAARGIPFGLASGVQRVGIPEKWLDRPYLEKPFTFADVSRLLSQLFAQVSEAIVNQPITAPTGPPPAQAQ